MSKTVVCRADQSHLLLIDIQEKLAGAMPASYLEKLLNNSQILLEAARELNIPAIHTEQYPKGLGHTHIDLQPALARFAAAIEKTCFSSCTADGMQNYIDDGRRSSWILLGMETHICVTQTCMDLLNNNKTVFIVADAVCSRHSLNYHIALSRMREAGAIITTTEAVLFEWLGDASHPQFRNLSRLIR